MRKTIKNFKYGIVSNIEASSIPTGSASSSLNYLTSGDKEELRRGILLLGTELTGTGKSFIKTAHKADGSEVLFKVRDRKLEYYDTTTSDWIEVGTDIFPANVDLNDITFAEYNSLAGSQLWINSPVGVYIKIMTANPGSYADMYDATKNFKGKIKIANGRTLLWVQGDKDKTGIYGSYIDNDELSDYTAVTTEAIAGTGLTRTGTLAFKAGGAKRTCFEVSFTDGTETFTDDYCGNLTGSAGGTGTINYMTGAYSITFAAAATTVTANYYWEDSTDNGIADFTKSSPRTAGQGFIFRQDDFGGETKNILSYGTTEYCFHNKKTWAVNITQDDTDATNLIFRDKVGIENMRGACATGDGIYYIDSMDKNRPKFRLLTLDSGSTEVIPRDISQNINLDDFLFDKACVFEYGIYILFACRTSGSTENNRVWVYNKDWKSWDLLDYYSSNFAIYDGALHCGDSVSDNVYELLSGNDDDESTISNYWISNQDNLDMERLKKVKRFIIEGTIGKDQTAKVYVSYDFGNFVEIGTIEGNASYVDHGQKIYVGAVTVGRSEVGGGGDGIDAYHYLKEIKINTDKFKYIKIKIEAQALGWFDFSLLDYQDIRRYQDKIPSKYR